MRWIEDSDDERVDESFITTTPAEQGVSLNTIPSLC